MQTLNKMKLSIMKRFFALLVILVTFTVQCWCSVNDYLNFTAVGGNATVSLKKFGTPYSSSIQYSTNGGSTWNSYYFGSAIQLNSGQKVYFKATSTNSQFGKGDRNNYYFEMSGTISADGNVMSLLDASMQRTSVPDYAFTKLFVNCSTMVQAPYLPATSLSSYCYSRMFERCSSLTQAPSLPATVMAEGCYGSMFRECTSLSQAPSLPATSLAKSCYGAMFSQCTSLAHAPNLPASTLAESCYYHMFDGCSLLVAMPTIAATVLAEACCEYMFQNCTSLTNITSLSATTLQKECYCGMFYGCSSLRQAPALPANTMKEQCYYNMFKGCAKLQNAPSLPATTLAIWCYMNMFQGCTSLAQAPSLPATKMYDKCYKAMFAGCTSLVALPILNATNLAKSCYQEMFKNCSSLTVNHSAPGTAWSIPANASVYDDWNTDMFAGTAGTMNSEPQKGVTYYVKEAATQYTITVLSDDYSMGTVDGGGIYDEGETAVLEAIPFSGYKFVRWSNGNRNVIMTVRVTSDATYTAYFEPETVSAVEVLNENVVSVMKNPVNVGEEICLIVNGCEDAIVEIFTLNGLCVKSQKTEGSSTMIGGLPAAGTYIIRVNGRGGNIWSDKLIVK